MSAPNMRRMPRAQMVKIWPHRGRLPPVGYWGPATRRLLGARQAERHERHRIRMDLRAELDTSHALGAQPPLDRRWKAGTTTGYGVRP